MQLTPAFAPWTWVRHLSAVPEEDNRATAATRACSADDESRSCVRERSFCNTLELKYRCATSNRGCTMARGTVEWKARRDISRAREASTNGRTRERSRAATREEQREEEKKDSFASGGTKYAIKAEPGRATAKWHNRSSQLRSSLSLSLSRSPINIRPLRETNFLTVVVPANYQAYILQDRAPRYTCLRFADCVHHSIRFFLGDAKFSIGAMKIRSFRWATIYVPVYGIFYDNSSLRKVRRLLNRRWSRLLSSAEMAINRLLISRTHRSVLRSYAIILSRI